MSIIDRLVIQLGMDTKGFSGEARKSVEQLREVEKQAQATGSGMERDGVKAASFFSGVRREALAMFAVFTAGKSLKAFIGDTTKANAQLDYMSQRLNMDPAGLNRLETAAKAAGGSFGEVAQSLGTLRQRWTDMQQHGAISLAFSKLGVPDFLDKNNQIREDIVARVNKGIHDNHIDRQLAIAYMRDVNFGEGMINQGLMDPDKFKSLQSAIHGMIAPSKEMTEQAQQLNQDLIILQQQSENLTTTFTSKLNPALDGAIKQLITLEKEHPDVAGALGIIKLSVDELTKSFGGLGAILAGMAGLGIVKRLLGLTGKGATLAGRGLGATAEGIAALGEPGVAALAGEGAISAAGFAALPAAAGAAGIYYGIKGSQAADAEIQQAKNDAPALADERRKYLYQALLDAKFSRNAALGVIGSIHKESGFNPLARGDAGLLGPQAFGIGQWHKARVRDILNRFGIDVRTASFKDQVRALILETQQGEDAGAKRAGSALRDPNITVEQASHVFRSDFERPKDADGTEDASRLRLALKARDALPENPDSLKVDPNSIALTQGSKVIGTPGTNNSPQNAMVLRYDAPKAEQESAIKRLAAATDAALGGAKPANALTREDVATLLRPRDAGPSVSPQADMLKAMRDQQAQAAQSIGTGEVSRMAASVTAGDSPGSVSNTSNATTNNANLHGDVIIQTNATDASGIARGIHDGLRQELAARSLMGVQ